MVDNRANTPCNDFQDSGKIFEFIKEPLCDNCEWTKSTHHKWTRISRSIYNLGLGWSCKVCGRTCYDKDSRCGADVPPIDYPPCGTYESQS